MELPNEAVLRKLYSGSVTFREYAEHLSSMNIASEREYNTQQTVKWLLREISRLEDELYSVKKENKVSISDIVNYFEREVCVDCKLNPRDDIESKFKLKSFSRKI